METNTEANQVNKTVSGLLSAFKNVTYVAASIFLVLNVWLTTKLAPLAQDLKIVDTRVYALENKQNHNDAVIDQFIAVKTKVSILQESVDKINDKLDKYLFGQ